jgi:hypothetical protein
MNPNSFESISSKQTPDHEGIVDVENIEVEQFKNLDITTPEGLRVFLENAEDVYVEAVKFSSTAEADGYKSLASGDQVFADVDKVFETLQALVNEVTYPAEDEISDEKIDEIQDKYNDLIELRNSIVETYETAEIVSVAKETEFPEENLVPANDDEYEEFTVSPSRKSKIMNIVNEDIEGSIKISVAEDAEKSIEKGQAVAYSFKPDPANNPFIPKSISSEDVSPLGVIEKNDPINQSIPNSAEQVVFAEKVHTRRSLTLEHLTDERYRTYLKENFRSPADFEKKLDAEISMIESEELSKFERTMGYEFFSVFELLQDMKVSDIKAMDASGQVRSVFEGVKDEEGKEVKYETFVAWMKLIDDMEHVVESDDNPSLGELFAKWYIEITMQNPD